MNDKEALQQIVFMVNDYVNKADYVSSTEFLEDFIKFLEENKVKFERKGRDKKQVSILPN